jgi:hypothetical protein
MYPKNSFMHNAVHYKVTSFGPSSVLSRKRSLFQGLQIIYVVFHGFRHTVSQIIQLGARFSLNIFIYFSSLHVSGIQVSIIRRKSLYDATLIFVTLYGWRLVCWLDWNPTSTTDATHTEWQIPVSCRYSNFPLMMGTWMPETCREEKWINIFKQNCVPSWIICEMFNL